ncbi:hypothetical protein E6C27_scaffold845G00710 [Cucumis melo var. makuwa]|uniref:Uncharacterized protein n=1 Tax=Cucumis melo var. makuwa TaxID=1194695 RepID=A0A5A7SUY3_CUCMM|nr:hypothetical protein E6C27_scaffold845G00710 [Cucumis melo var. makuwa]
MDIMLKSILANANNNNNNGARFSKAWLEIASLPWICQAWISIEGHNRVSGKGFPTTGPRVQAKTVVIHRGLHVSDCTEYLYGLVCIKHWSGCGSWSLDGEGHTRLICASFGSTRLICASFGSARLICASFGSTRLICRVTARGRPTRGRKDA